MNSDKGKKRKKKKEVPSAGKVFFLDFSDNFM